MSRLAEERPPRRKSKIEPISSSCFGNSRRPGLRGNLSMGRQTPLRLSGGCLPPEARETLLGERVQAPDEDRQALGEARPTSP